MKAKNIALTALTILGVGSFLSTVWADDSNDFIKSRVYIGALGISTNIDTNDDFNGTKVVVPLFTAYEKDLIPSIDRNVGFGGLAGYREGAYAVEVSYWRTDHNATWSTLGTNFYGKASYQSLNVDFKRYLFTNLPTQPFFSFGVSFPWLVVKQASIDSLGNIGDVSISGLGFNLGVGLEIYTGDGFSILGGAVQRWSNFSDYMGVNKNVSNFFNADFTQIGYQGNGLNFFLGGTVSFE